MARLNRRLFLAASALGAAGAARAKTAARISVEGLRAAQMTQPIGLVERAPNLSWRLVSDAKGAMQTAYRVKVASSLALLGSQTPDLWDSGRVPGGQTTGVTYRGRPIGSRQKVWWTVTAWLADGQSATATPSTWETGLLDAADWRSDWIAAEDAIERADREAGLPAFVGPAPASKDAARLFKLPFVTEVEGEVLCTVFSSGFLRNLTVDGAVIDLPKAIYEAFGGPPAQRFSVRLAPGQHVLATEVTPPHGFTVAKEVSIAAQLRTADPQGGVRRIVDGWLTADAETKDWRLPGANAAGWTPAAAQVTDWIAPWPPSPAVQLRKGFETKAAPVRARLYVTALGGYEMRLNGAKVGDHLLETETSDFRKTILVRTYDVTAMIRAGANTLGATVGDGWYASYAAPAGRYAFGPAPRRLLSQLEIEFSDGTTQTISTDETWRMDASPITASELYNGEVYDARLTQVGWDTPGFDDSQWAWAKTASRPQGQLTAHAAPPIRVTRRLAPLTIKTLSDGRAIVDFGQNFAGVCRLRVKGARGQTVVLRFAEVLNADGSADQRNLRAARATDTYILSGATGGEVHQPRFTYHGFRYVEVVGAPKDWTLEGLVIGSDLPETGLLKVENPLIQKLWLNTLWSQRSNFVAIPTDCPQRDERLGWTGDAQVFWDAAAYNMDVGAFTRRFLHDLRDGQSPSGAFPIFAPAASSPPGATPGWADAGVMLPWIAWRRYGDTRVITEHWDAMSRYIAGVVADNPDLIWRVVKGPNFGDWLSLDAVAPGDETTPRALVATAMLKRSLDQIADMGEAVGRRREADTYRAMAQAAARAFQAAFVSADGVVGNGSHASYILALGADMLPPRLRQAAGAKLAAAIRQRGTLLTTGFLGTPLSLDALADVGETELVYDLLLREEFPSWGYMVKRGATTIWERWNGDTGDVAMNSFNHYALGAVCGFLYRRIAGIEETSPGFETFRVKPLIDARVRSAGADYDSVRGRISTRWSQKASGAFALELTVPANTLAEVHIPAAPSANLRESGRALLDRDGIRLLRSDPDRQVFEVGGGSYRFEARA